jgi:hypothetical protein
MPNPDAANKIMQGAGMSGFKPILVGFDGAI